MLLGIMSSRFGTNMNFNKKVACGNFVKRQTKESGYSHFIGSWEELEDIVINTMDYPSYINQGYRDGILIVDLRPPHWFYSGVVKLDSNSKLTARYSPRRLGEASFINTAVKANKQVAKHASVVLYRHDILAENNERETNAEWEIVALKARVNDEEDPMDPYTMARNFLHLDGGTKGDFTAEQFAKSIVYWNSHAMVLGKPKWYQKIISFLRQLRMDIIENSSKHWENYLDIRH